MPPTFRVRLVVVSGKSGSSEFARLADIHSSESAAAPFGTNDTNGIASGSLSRACRGVCGQVSMCVE